MVVFARINVKEPGAISIEENRTKLFLETVSLANAMMTLPSELCTARAPGEVSLVLTVPKARCGLLVAGAL
ncbi:hypothetical protein [Microcoleus sp. herbarium2]|uniref:hypothetical protein n=1 Tax=Microcoleus sp. herbarium2 TaxID=3055433 RepID=UPI002FD45B52